MEIAKVARGVCLIAGEVAQVEVSIANQDVELRVKRVTRKDEVRIEAAMKKARRRI